VQQTGERTDLHGPFGKRDRATAPLGLALSPTRSTVTSFSLVAHTHASTNTTSFMTDTTAGAPVPKKRSFFKRAAWQDAPKEQDDIFSHAKNFKHVVAEQNRREEEEKHAKAEEERIRKYDAKHNRKRRKVSSEVGEASVPTGGSGSSARTSKMSNKAYEQRIKYLRRC
jgi:hypothetical protein